MKCFIMNHKSQGEKGLNGVIWRSMENVRKKALHISGGLSCLLFVYDHHQGPVALAASRVRTSGPTSSTSEIYNTQTSSPVRKEKVGLTCYHIILSFPIALVYYYTVKWFDEWLHSKAKSVIKVQVVLSGTHRSLQRDLKRIAGASTSKGLTYVLHETILALLRHSDYYISGYSSVDVKRRPMEDEKRFNHLYIEERGKFDEETLVTVYEIRKKSATSQRSNNKYIAVSVFDMIIINMFPALFY
ncbi:hypothetical protein L1987_45640 [Smallanthus sonchifolius]|uniref:Uncharacterized protein n=1 Tax=Smallanthus sonchifolius TaxID=185202 RepID=A0ACB9FXE9_9ASTR|nr:hypothetical protein L1987_45640 [Smallanthus sonchifolius]